MSKDTKLSLLILAAFVALGCWGAVTVYRAAQEWLSQKEAEVDASPASTAEAPPSQTPPTGTPLSVEEAPVPEGDAGAPPTVEAGELEPTGEEIEAMRNAGAPAEVPPPPPVTFERRCRDGEPSTLALSALVSDPALVQVYLEGHRVALPPGAALPPVVRVQGLDVLVYASATSDAAPDRLCLDQDFALADWVAARASRPPAVALGPGAWLVSGAAGAAIAALVAPGLAEAFPTKGALLAFAPSDELVAFADAADPKAVALAAHEVTLRIDTSAGGGCVTDVPLVRANDGWSAWKAPPRHPASSELQLFRATAFECRVALTVGLLDSVRELGAAAAAHGGGTLRFELPDLELTERTQLAGSVHSLVELAGSPGPQLLPQSDVVEFDVSGKGLRASMPWATFRRVAGRHLRPLEVGHRSVARCFQLEPGLTPGDFAGVKGVTMQPSPAAAAPETGSP